MVIWIIGLSGSGKTTAGNYITKIFRSEKKKVIFFDGDMFREITDNDLGYSINDRKINSSRIQEFCKFLEAQNLIVICSILSIFEDHRIKNKKIFHKYIQIYIKTKLNNLKKRDHRKIYNIRKNIVGEDIIFEIPKKSNYEIENNTSKRNFYENLKKISEEILSSL
jgi:adenylylsulfate kinase-like enzyme